MNTWLLLRGLTRDARHWGDFPEHLAVLCPTARIVAVDLPGNGSRHRERSPASIAGMVRDVRAAAAALRPEGPVGVVSMSLGAMVTASWAQAHPEEVACAVLIGTSLRAHSPLTDRLQAAAWPDVLRAAVARDPLRAEAAIWRLTSRRPAADQASTVARWATWRRDQPVSVANAMRQLWAAALHRGPSTAPAVPLLLMAGAGDELVAPACSAALSRAWHVPLRVHPWAGHDLPLDDPAWVARTLVDWVDGGGANRLRKSR